MRLSARTETVLKQFFGKEETPKAIRDTCEELAEHVSRLNDGVLEKQTTLILAQVGVALTSLEKRVQKIEDAFKDAQGEIEPEQEEVGTEPKFEEG